MAIMEVALIQSGHSIMVTRYRSVGLVRRRSKGIALSTVALGGKMGEGILVMDLLGPVLSTTKLI